MTWEIFVSLIVAITGLIGALWAIIKYYDRKREAKQNERDTFMIEMRAENKQQSENIQTILSRTDMLETRMDSVQADLKQVHTQLNMQERIIDEHEMSRLQTAIMDFSNFLRNGNFATLNNFNYIFHAYDQYKALNGNSFIDSEMEFIKAKKKEFNFTDEH